MEEPQKAQRIMREDVLAGTNSFADGFLTVKRSECR
jgi:hypothetical protein